MLPEPKASDVRSHILQTAQRLIAARGFAGVGLTEILKASGVPKGSFYHYFSSKESFGRDLLEHYFSDYLLEMEGMMADTSIPAADRLDAYWRFWRNNQEQDDPEGRCLAVKLGAEVSDISEDMRQALKTGTAAIIQKLSRTIRQGLEDGSIISARTADDLAATLYQLWLGASIMSKITRDGSPFDAAETATRYSLSGTKAG